jgi:hypothetical protein
MRSREHRVDHFEALDLLTRRRSSALETRSRASAKKS